MNDFERPVRRSKARPAESGEATASQSRGRGKRLGEPTDRYAETGRPLDMPVRTRMEAAFGSSFERVRLHDDAAGANLSRDLNAHAVTLGEHVAFADGRYRPGTPAGDALLAHELAHVLQQGAAEPSLRAAQPTTPDHVVEQDADRAAAGAMVSLYAPNLAAGERRPRMQTGLRLSRCQVPAAVAPPAMAPLATARLRSNRFRGYARFEAIVAPGSTSVIRQPASGIHVSILQQSLLDAGFALPAHGVSGVFNDETRAAVEAFQTSKGLSGSSVNGIIDAVTMNLLDDHFLRHRPERNIAMNPARALSEGTRTLSAREIAAANAAITTEVRTATGGLPTFSRTISTHPDPYEVRIRDTLNDRITSLHTSLVASRPSRIPANMLAAWDINRVAHEAQVVTNRVFGRYYGPRPPFAVGTNIFDAFIRRDTEISASTVNADRAANFRVLKLLTDDREILEINRQHGAVRTRAAEWALIASVTGFPTAPALTEERNGSSPPHVTTGIVGTRRTELLDIHRNWPAYAGGGRIFLDMMRASTDAENRDKMYELFGTVIHEYIHTLEHPAHVSYRTTLADERGGFVLREGMTDYLAKIVWDGVTFDAPLRARIEGSFHDPTDPMGHVIRLPARYRTWARGERLAGVVGIRNVLAAFFQGRTELIGRR